MNVFKLFPTTVIEFDLSKYSNKNKLLEYINSTPVKSHDLIKNGISSHNPNYDDNDFLKNPIFSDLRDIFTSCIREYSSYLKLFPSEITQSWFNISTKEGITLQHNHGSSIISGAYYPFLPPNSSPLTFCTPIYSALNYQVTPDNENYHKEFIINVKENHLYLFPGWLNHKSETNQSERRIVVSFNTQYNIYDGLRN